MKIAVLTSENSYATRSKVGAVVVREGRIISLGWNGTPSGFDNNCEEKYIKGPSQSDIGFRTKPEVIHAEVNAIYFCAKHGISINDATLYTTLSPCANCALAMIQAGIKEVYYLEEYHDRTGVEILQKAGIKIKQIKVG